jgi:hypothetical protein
LWSANGGNGGDDALRSICGLACSVLATYGDQSWLAIGDLKGLNPTKNNRQGSRLADMDTWLGSGALAAARKGPEKLFDHVAPRVNVSIPGEPSLFIYGGTDFRLLFQDAHELTGGAPTRILFSSILNNGYATFKSPHQGVARWLASCDVCVCPGFPHHVTLEAADHFTDYGRRPPYARRFQTHDPASVCSMFEAIALRKSLDDTVSTPRQVPTKTLRV